MGEGAMPPSCRLDRSNKKSHHERDVFHAWHLELADLRRRPDGAGTDRAGRLPVLARACGAIGRGVVVRDPSVLAGADPDVRGFCCRRGAAVAAHRAQQYRRQQEPSVSEQARRCAGRPGVYAGETDHRRGGHGADRRYDLARRRSRRAGRQPGADRAGRWRQPDGGCGLDQFASTHRAESNLASNSPKIAEMLSRCRTACMDAWGLLNLIVTHSGFSACTRQSVVHSDPATGIHCVESLGQRLCNSPDAHHHLMVSKVFLESGAYAPPARRMSCRCTMPTGLPASVTISAVIFEELSISSASLASRSPRIVFGFFVITSSTSAVIRSGRSMWRRRSPSVTMPTICPRESTMPTQPKPLEVISTSASDIRVPSGLSGPASPACIRSRVYFSIAPSLPPGCSTLKSTEVKPRPSNSAIASASPSASIISEEVVGARLCGQASRAFGSVSATSAAWLRVESRSAVMAIIAIRNRLA